MSTHPLARRAALRLAAILALVLLVSFAAAACSGGDDASAGTDRAATTAGHDEHATTAGHDEHATTAQFEGGVVEPRRAAPPLTLADSTGAPFDLTSLHGTPTLVTFVYASCPDVCPLIMQRLKDVRRMATRKGIGLNVVAVSVDPEGDTPEVVSDFLRRQRLTSFVRYLIGDRATMQKVWSDWGVATDVPTDNPELIEHTALIYGVTAGGELATAYPVEFDPASITRDLELLAET